MKPNKRMAERCSHSQMVHCSKCHHKPDPDILMSGYLTKSPPLNKSTLVKRWKIRYFILRGDSTLEYYDNYKSHVPLGVINLELTQRLEAGLETKKYANIFDLIMPGRTYFFSAGQLEIMFDWVTQIKYLLGIGEDVVYPQKSAPKPLNPSNLLLQVYIKALSRPPPHTAQSVPILPSQCPDLERSNSQENGAQQAAEMNEVTFRASLIQSNHYTVLQRLKPGPATQLGSPIEVTDELSSGTYQEMDSLGIQWADRTGSFTKLKELILSTGKGVIPSPPPTRFYSHEELSDAPDYATVHKLSSDSEQLEFKDDYLFSQKSKSFDESYDPNPPPIPPKFRSKSPRPDPPRQLPLPPPPPDRGLQQRLPSLGKIRRIRVSGSAKEGVGNFSSQTPPDPASDPQLAATDDSDVVCFGAIIKKVFGCNGGRICFRESHIEVEVPRGAISQGHIQGFYFKVSPDSGFVEERGEDGHATHVCSPLLQFGPVGAKFHEPIRIKMPHCLSLDVEDYHVQLILAYGDVFSANGLNYIRIDVCKEDFELEMFSFNTILGPVVFNLQPDYVIMEISHFVFQWVQLVGVSRSSRPGRDAYIVCKRLRLACFLSGASGLRPALSLYLYNDYNDVFNKILESEQKHHSQFLCETDPVILSADELGSGAQISLSELEFGYKVDGRCKQAASVPTHGDTCQRSVFQLEKLFDHTKPFTCEVQLRAPGRLVTLDIESVAAQPRRVTEMKRELTCPGRQQELADTLGLSCSESHKYPLSLLTEAHRKYGCELDRVSEALRQLDATELLLSPCSPSN